MRPYLYVEQQSFRDRLSVSHPAHRAKSSLHRICILCRFCFCSENIRTISDYVLAMAYVPWQHFSTVYEPDRSLSADYFSRTG